MLIGQLQDQGSPVSEPVLLAILRRTGTEAFEAVLGALQTSALEEAPHRLLRAFTAFGARHWTATLAPSCLAIRSCGARL